MWFDQVDTINDGEADVEQGAGQGQTIGIPSEIEMDRFESPLSSKNARRDWGSSTTVDSPSKDVIYDQENVALSLTQTRHPPLSRQTEESDLGYEIRFSPPDGVERDSSDL